MLLDESFRAFRIIVLPSASRSSGPRFGVLGELGPDDKDTTLLRNVRIYSPNDTASQLKRPESSAMKLWETKFSLPKIIFVMGMSLQKSFMRNNYLHTCGEYVRTVACGTFIHSCGSWRNPLGNFCQINSQPSFKLDAFQTQVRCNCPYVN